MFRYQIIKKHLTLAIGALLFSNISWAEPVKFADTEALTEVKREDEDLTLDFKGFSVKIPRETISKRQIVTGFISPDTGEITLYTNRRKKPLELHVFNLSFIIKNGDITVKQVTRNEVTPAEAKMLEKLVDSEESCSAGKCPKFDFTELLANDEGVAPTESRPNTDKIASADGESKQNGQRPNARGASSQKKNGAQGGCFRVEDRRVYECTVNRRRQRECRWIIRRVKVSVPCPPAQPKKPTTPPAAPKKPTLPPSTPKNPTAPKPAEPPETPPGNPNNPAPPSAPDPGPPSEPRTPTKPGDNGMCRDGFTPTTVGAPTYDRGAQAPAQQVGQITFTDQGCQQRENFGFLKYYCSATCSSATTWPQFSYRDWSDCSNGMRNPYPCIQPQTGGAQRRLCTWDAPAKDGPTVEASAVGSGQRDLRQAKIAAQNACASELKSKIFQLSEAVSGSCEPGSLNCCCNNNYTPPPNSSPIDQSGMSGGVPEINDSSEPGMSKQ